MGPKMAINLFAIGTGATILLIVESLLSDSLTRNAPIIVISAVVAVVGGVRILQIRRQQKL